MRLLQPLLHEQVVLVHAPAQAMTNPDATFGEDPIHGIYHSDVRILRHYTATLGDSPLEYLSWTQLGASSARHLRLARQLDPEGADPRTTLATERSLSATPQGATFREDLTLTHAWDSPLHTELRLELAADLSPMDLVKSGQRLEDLAWELTSPSTATVTRGAVNVTLSAPGATLHATESTLTLTWPLTASRTSPARISWSLSATDRDAVVQCAPELPARKRPLPADARVAAWEKVAFDDLDHLLLARTQTPSQAFAAAGAPWFLTLFGRDCLWAARLVLQSGDPWSLALMDGTLRTLADLQGRNTDLDTAEQAGKIMHELRRATNNVNSDVVLPPLYYGTIDATELWICAFAEAIDAGLPERSIRDLLPALRSALTWLTEEADADGDGFIEYLDTSGHGLANQGWKDSGDSVQHADGSLARGPIALVEVQAYAYAAARAGARILRSYGDGADRAGASALMNWAATLRERFLPAFWVGSLEEGFPAIALDAAKKPVASLTSNIGHLLGTGILPKAYAARVADLLVSPELSSGYGLRTLATSMDGYWPLSYHGGSVWTHDTAIAIDGLLREGFTAQARILAEGLLAAAPTFNYRMPELYAGYSAQESTPVPYPASCRPQAWAAAAVAAAARALAASDNPQHEA